MICTVQPWRIGRSGNIGATRGKRRHYRIVEAQQAEELQTYCRWRKLIMMADEGERCYHYRPACHRAHLPPTPGTWQQVGSECLCLSCGRVAVTPIEDWRLAKRVGETASATEPAAHAEATRAFVYPERQALPNNQSDHAWPYVHSIPRPTTNTSQTTINDTCNRAPTQQPCRASAPLETRKQQHTPRL